MTSRRTPLIALLLALMLPPLTGACAAPSGDTGGGASVTAPEVADPAALGREQVDRFMSSLKGSATDLTVLDGILAENFQLVRSDGTRADKAAYLASPATVDTYDVSNINVTLDGTSLVVSFDVAVDEEIEGRRVVSTAPRLGAFRWDGSDWRLTAWSNFGVLRDPADEG